MMHWYLTTLTRQGAIVEWGWMLAADDNELIQYARTMGYGISIVYLGPADMSAIFPTIAQA